MTAELFVIELRELPVAVLSRAQEHNFTLVRELALVHAADERGVAPARLLWLSQHLDERYAAFNDAPRQRIQSAIEGDESHIDIQYQVPADAHGTLVYVRRDANSRPAAQPQPHSAGATATRTLIRSPGSYGNRVVYSRPLYS